MSWRAGEPFRLGVASGSPAQDGFVLWTRLAPEPLSPETAAPGGLPQRDIEIGYEIAEDPAFRRVVQSGSAMAEVAFAHSVHLEAHGLAPGRPYFYRFFSGDAVSKTGRAVTAPLPGHAERVRFGFCSCANYEQGYFSAYRHLAAEAPDLVLFLGDYIYESADPSPNVVRRHSDGRTATSLALYRNRYAQYRMDPDLQHLHAASTSLATWDDHEVQNDYAAQYSETLDPPTLFLKRRAAAYQAFYEHMPLRPSLSRPHGAALRLYDHVDWGGLIRIFLLDGRQYRSPEACYGPGKGGGHVETLVSCPELGDPARSMLGWEQERWLQDGLHASSANWNLLAQNVLMARMASRHADGAFGAWTEAWDGYPQARARLLTHLRDARIANPVVIGGDNHAFWVNDLKPDFDDLKAPAVATELIGGSITSHGPSYEATMKIVAQNPHVRFFESRRRGYAMVDLTSDRMITRLRTVSDAADPAATVSTLSSFVVESGKAGALTA
ncbi:MAG TPA: alkaline phosphatase D family protein [Dongiaceae bacterium]|nr:alkaline phosphatase D family protein [Dongiaceae bacterium]